MCGIGFAGDLRQRRRLKSVLPFLFEMR